MPLCKLRQFRISSALDGRRELSASLQNHVDACASCREFLTRSRSLESRLRPGSPQGDSPPWLHTEIMARVRASVPAEEPRSWLPAIIGASAIAVAALVITFGVNRAQDQPPEVAEVPLRPPVATVHPGLVPGHFEKHAKQALSKEFQNLAADITGAKNFLNASLRNTIPGLGE